MLAQEAGSALGDAPCPSCKGTFVPSEGVERLVHRELGLEISTLRELMGPHAGTQLKCPSCAFAMSHVQLKGVPLELCTGCGGVWLDEGELERLSLGRYTYTAPPSPAERFADLATDFVPTGTLASVDVESAPDPPPKRRLGCLGSIAVVYAGGFGLAMLATAVSFGSWALVLVGFGGLGLVAMVLHARNNERPGELGPVEGTAGELGGDFGDGGGGDGGDGGFGD